MAPGLSRHSLHRLQPDPEKRNTAASIPAAGYCGEGKCAVLSEKGGGDGGGGVVIYRNLLLIFHIFDNYFGQAD